MSSTISLRDVKKYFPSLKRKVNGKPLILFDGPGGTQIPVQVINAVSGYYRRSNANTHAHHITSVETDRILREVRAKMAVFLNAEGPQNISIGQNMTSLAFSLSRALARFFRKGDEVVITQLDHEANRGPWLALREYGIKIREIKLKPDGTLDDQDMRSKVNENTRMVALGWASNAIGTVNDLQVARMLTREVGAYLLVDAVHYAPHFLMDVRKEDIDFLLCSSYKFYGPHAGFLYSKEGLLDGLMPDRLSTQFQQAPYSMETGTLNHAALNGVISALDFISALGEGNSFREKIISALEKIQSHEKELARLLYGAISVMKQFQVIGPDFDQGLRAPTISFYHRNKNSSDVSLELAKNGFGTSYGHFYASRAIEVLGLKPYGGVVRLGISLYHNPEDIEKVTEALKLI